MEIWSLLIRTTVIYFVVFLIMRFMGKREIGKLSVLDLVISVMVAEIAVIVIEDTERSMWDGIVPMVMLLLIQVSTAMISMNNRKMRLLFDGKPSVIIAKGKINREVMRKQRYNLDDLMLQLRENKITSVADVEFAILETSGKLSVIPKDGAEEADSVQSTETPDINVETSSHTPLPRGREKIIPPGFRYEILPIPLIMDGKVQDENLGKIEKTRFWLKNVLQDQKVTDFKDVFLCTIDHKGKLFVDVNQKKIT
ncbi:YetF domain-containing protein [Paenibacillus sp. NPDC057967]|uniref:YetF domain-containing protein n=1 Tax=Paenibacillus sp. NPDC057967 TaxID=3346293 RepID=UPI0036DEAABA